MSHFVVVSETFVAGVRFAAKLLLFPDASSSDSTELAQKDDIETGSSPASPFMNYEAIIQVQVASDSGNHGRPQY